MACIPAGAPPRRVAGTSQSVNPNRTITATVTEPGGVSAGETVVVSVATGTFAGAVGCTDSKNNIYTVVADKNTGNGRLFVCTSKLALPLVQNVDSVAQRPIRPFSGL